MVLNIGSYRESSVVGSAISSAPLCLVRVLQLTKKFPYPLRDGESWAVTGLARGIKSTGASISLFAFNTDQHFADGEDIDALKALNIYDSIQSRDITAKVSKIGALKNLFSRQSYHEERFYSSVLEDDLLSHMSAAPCDVLLVESVFLMTYAMAVKKLHPHVKIVLRAHNVEHLIWERYAAGHDNAIKAWYFGLQSRRLKNFETRMLPLADGMLTVSSVDQDALEKRCGVTLPSIVAPIAMAPAVPIREREDLPFILGYIGSLDWRPNLEGLDWFFKKVWPGILDKDLDTVMMVAGRNAANHPKYRGLGQISFLGEVDDSHGYMDRVDCIIVPLLSGSGTRVKVLQALSQGTPVIGTTIAFEGLGLSHDEEVIIADTPDEWIAGVERLIFDPAKTTALADQGLRYIENNHAGEEIGKRVVDFISEL